MKKLGKIKDLLSREEMKQIQGGSGSGSSCAPWLGYCIPGRHENCCSALMCSGSSCILID
jgi:hypothetical protein